MNRFPREFTDLLSDRAIAGIHAFARKNADIRREKLFWFPMVCSRTTAAAGVDLLERKMRPLLRPVKGPIPRSTITKMRSNYSEVLPKTLRNNAVSLNTKGREAYRIAERIGLVQMLRSDSLRQLLEKLCGFRLDSDPGCQVLCYGPGDYVGPHNDHHPEAENLRRGYVDFQMTLSTDGVAHQWLVFERKGYLQDMVEVGIASGMSISFLPFWHYTTPLMAKPRKSATAKRWLLLASFSRQN
jgi:hypothetical protein